MHNAIYTSPVSYPLHVHAYLCFGSDVQEVESEDVCWDTRLLGIVTKHSNSTTLGKLAMALLVLEVLCMEYSYVATIPF